MHYGPILSLLGLLCLIAAYQDYHGSRSLIQGLVNAWEGIKTYNKTRVWPVLVLFGSVMLYVNYIANGG